MQCSTCRSRDIEFVESSGHAVCVQCGTVLEENSIVSSVEFQETGDRSHLIGKFISATSGKSYGSSTRGHSRYGFARESREVTLAAARRNIAQVASSMRLPSYYVERAHRLYSLSLQTNFVYGRRQMIIVAVVLYTICRQEKSPHLLIDFSDVLRINVYTLGQCFLQLVRLLCLKVPVVDPSLYIHRFGTRLELGEKMSSVCTTALRIVTRMKKDWIHTGRRPDGVCAAAMLIASRSHGFSKNVMEIANLFRISVGTLKSRLRDFKQTPSAQLTVDQFHVVDLGVEQDPPCFIEQQADIATKEGGYVMYNLSVNEDTPLIVAEEEIMIDEKGNRVQATDTNGIKLQVPLPNSKVAKQEALLNKRKSSAVKVAKDKARKDLYGQMYQDAFDSSKLTIVVMEDERVRDKLYVESQENDASTGPVGGWGELPSKLPPNKAIVQFDPLNPDSQHEIRQSELSKDFHSDEIDSFILTDAERQKRNAVWESMHRSYLDEREKKRRLKEDSKPSAKTPKVPKRDLSQIQKSHIGLPKEGTTSIKGPGDPKKSSKNINYSALNSVHDGADEDMDQRLLTESHYHDTENMDNQVQPTRKKIVIGTSLANPALVDSSAVKKGKTAPTNEANSLGSITDSILKEDQNVNQDDANAEETVDMVDDDYDNDNLVYEDQEYYDDYANDDDEYY